MAVDVSLMSHREVMRMNELLDRKFREKTMSDTEEKELEELIEKSCSATKVTPLEFLKAKKTEYLRRKTAEEMGNYEH